MSAWSRIRRLWRPEPEPEPDILDVTGALMDLAIASSSVATTIQGTTHLYTSLLAQMAKAERGPQRIGFFCNEYGQVFVHDPSDQMDYTFRAILKGLLDPITLTTELNFDPKHYPVIPNGGEFQIHWSGTTV